MNKMRWLLANKRCSLQVYSIFSFHVIDIDWVENSLRTGSRLRGAQQIYRSAPSAGNEVRSAEEGEPARKSQNGYL